MKYLLYTVARTEDNKVGPFHLCACFSNRVEALEEIHTYRREEKTFRESEEGGFMGKILGKFGKFETKFILVEVSDYEIL